MQTQTIEINCPCGQKHYVVIVIPDPVEKPEPVSPVHVPWVQPVQPWSQPQYPTFTWSYTSNNKPEAAFIPRAGWQNPRVSYN